MTQPTLLQETLKKTKARLKSLSKSGIKWGAKSTVNAVAAGARKIKTETKEAWEKIEPTQRTQTFAVAGSIAGRQVETFINDVKGIARAVRTKYERKQYGKWCHERVPGLLEAVNEVVRLYKENTASLEVEIEKEGYAQFRIGVTPEQVTTSYLVDVVHPTTKNIEARNTQIQCDVTLNKNVKSTQEAVNTLPELVNLLAEKLTYVKGMEHYSETNTPSYSTNGVPLFQSASNNVNAGERKLTFTIMPTQKGYFRKPTPVAWITYVERDTRKEE